MNIEATPISKSNSLKSYLTIQSKHIQEMEKQCKKQTDAAMKQCKKHVTNKLLVNNNSY